MKIQILLTISSVIFLLAYYLYVWLYIRNIGKTNQNINFEKHYDIIAKNFMLLASIYFIVIMAVLSIFQERVEDANWKFIIILLILLTVVNVALSTYMTTTIYDKFLEIMVLQIKKAGTNDFTDLIIDRTFTTEIRYKVMVMTFINIVICVVSYWI